MTTIEEKLDQLAEFQNEKDNIEAKKRALLDDVKVPAEVLEVMRLGNMKIQECESLDIPRHKNIDDEVNAKLAEITIPEEIKIALAEIDRQRNLVMAYQQAKHAEIREITAQKRREIQSEIEKNTAQVYEDIAQRKLDIEAEFSGANSAVDANIAKLKAEIEDAVLAAGETKKGKYFMAVYNKGRVGTWNSGKLDGLALILPQIADCRNPGGDPTVTFRAVK